MNKIQINMKYNYCGDIMANKSKTKGKRFENIVAKMICTQFNIDSKYIKRAGSSGVRLDEHGDIDINHPYIEEKFPFVIECKNNERWKFNDIFGKGTENKSNIFLEFINQTNQKRYDDKYGLIVFSKNYEDVYGMVYSDGNDLDNKLLDEICELIDNKVISKIGEYRVVIFRFQEFLEKWYSKYLNSDAM